MSLFHRPRPAFRGDFPDTGETLTELLDRVRPADYDTQPPFTGQSDIGIPDGVIAIKQHGRDTQPIAAIRPAETTGPMQRMPKLRKVQQRPRPTRPADAAIWIWSDLLSQHIMLCGVCTRSRYADPTTAHMPFPFEALRVSAYQAGWRLDAFARWACPACQRTEAYRAPYGMKLWAPGAHESRAAGDLDGEQALYAAAEHQVFEDVNGSAQRGKHAARAS